MNIINRLKKDSPTIIHVVIVVAVLFVFILSKMGSVEPSGQSHQWVIYEKIVPNCYILETTGRPCPTCGMTRGFYAVFDGQFHLAWDLNYMVYPALSFLVLVLLTCVDYLRKRSYNQWLLRLLILNAGVVVMGFLIRYSQFFMNYSS